MFTVAVFHVADDLGEQVGTVDGLGMETVQLPIGDLAQVLVIQTHENSASIRCFDGRERARTSTQL